MSPAERIVAMSSGALKEALQPITRVQTLNCICTRRSETIESEAFICRQIYSLMRRCRPSHPHHHLRRHRRLRQPQMKQRLPPPPQQRHGGVFVLLWRQRGWSPPQGSYFGAMSFTTSFHIIVRKSNPMIAAPARYTRCILMAESFFRRIASIVNRTR